MKKLLKKIVPICLIVLFLLNSVACDNEITGESSNKSENLCFVTLNLYDPEADAETASSVEVLEDFVYNVSIPEKHDGMDFIGYSDESGETFYTDEKGLSLSEWSGETNLVARYQYHEITFKIIIGNATVDGAQIISCQYGADLVDQVFPIARKKYSRFLGYTDANGEKVLVNEQGKINMRYSKLTNENFEIKNNFVYLYPLFGEPSDFLITLVKGLSQASEAYSFEIKEGTPISEILKHFQNLSGVRICADLDAPYQTEIPSSYLLTSNDVSTLYLFEYCETVRINGEVQNTKTDNGYDPIASSGALDIEATFAVGEVGEVYRKTIFKNGKFIKTEILFTAKYDFPTLIGKYSLSNDGYCFKKVGAPVGYGMFEAKVGDDEALKVNFLVNLKKGKTITLLSNTSPLTFVPKIQLSIMFEIYFRYGFLDLGNGFANTRIDYKL